MNLAEAKQKLQVIHQEQLLRYWETLTEEERNALLAQIDDIDTQMLEVQRDLVEHPESVAILRDIAPIESWDVTGAATDEIAGRKRVADGKVGCLVVAGGQGSRLGFNGPKGLFPVTAVKHKTLFQMLCERVGAAGRQAGRLLNLAVMTSSLNDAETRRYFQENRFFGLAPEQVSFFVQGVLPIVGDCGELFLKDSHTIVEGPDGNGFALHHFFHSGLWQQWQQMGIEEIVFIQVDNALSDPFDAELIGYHQRQQTQVTIKATYRQSTEEKVGIVVEHDGKIKVLEYTELPEDERVAINVDGSLQYQIANLSMFCFSMSFLQMLAKQPPERFPLHLAHKSHRVLGNDGQPQEIKAWKCERFIFDVLPYAERVSVLVYPRDLCYAPLKNGSGPDSLAGAQEALQHLDRRTFTAISGIEPPPERRFELAADFYYPTTELLNRWKGVSLPPTDYISLMT